MVTGRHSYIRFYPSDWIAGTARLSRLLRSIYHDVCLHNWDYAEPLPRATQKLVFGDVPDWPEQVQMLVDLGKLKRTKGGGLFSERALIAARSSLDRFRIAQASGKEGAAKRWKTKEEKNGHPNGVSIANHNHIEEEERVEEKEKILRIVKKETPDVALPDCIPDEAWREFLAMRRGIKKPATPFAQRKLASKLADLDRQGFDVAKLLERSIINNWQDVFEPRANEVEQYRKRQPARQPYILKGDC